MANSYVEYEADGATQTFTVTFPFINVDHVEAYVDAVEDTTFTWATSSSITLSAMPDAAAIVLIKRVTPKDERLVDFEAGNTVSEDNLDTDSQQNFFAMQEVLEEHADKMGLDSSDSEWDAETYPIKNVGDPTNDQDVVTKKHLDDTFQADLNTAVAAAESHETNAETAWNGAIIAWTDATIARIAAETAETNAETAETDAQTAQAAAETAQAAAEVATRNHNILINQDFSIWQEAISFTNPVAGTYIMDGYANNKSDGAGTAPSTNVKKNSTDMEVGFEQCCELEITNVGTAGAARTWSMFQAIKDYKKYRGKTVTLSIRIKASTAITLPGKITLYAVDESVDLAITSLGTDYITYTTTLTLSDTTSALSVYFVLVDASGAGTISTTGSIYIQWMKLELGSTATPFSPRSHAEEYLLCGTVTTPKSTANPIETFVNPITAVSGFVNRARFTYKDADEIYIDPFVYHHYGTTEQLVYSDSQLTKQLVGAGADTWYYLYVDDSAIVTNGGVNLLTASELIFSTTNPAWNNLRHGWYNGADRCIFAVLTNGSNNILPFWHDGGDLVKYDSGYEALAMTNINTTWSDIIMELPAFSTKCTTYIIGEYVDGTSIIQVRTNGSAGVGFSICYVKATNPDPQNTTILMTDATQTIEVRMTVINGNKMQVSATGWYFPGGM